MAWQDNFPNSMELNEISAQIKNLLDTGTREEKDRFIAMYVEECRKSRDVPIHSWLAETTPLVWERWKEWKAQR